MKITKNQLKKLIMEEIGGMPSRGEGNIYPGYGHIMNFANGQAPDNKNAEPYKGREPYEAGEMPEPELEDGEMYVTQGKNVYILQFSEDSDRMSGRVIPVGSYEFTVDPGNNSVSWFDNTPANVRFDSNLCQQILEFRGVDK